MSYQVLARKWRPNTFDEVVGQAHVVRALRNALAEGRIAQAYLFSGIRGVGKTSVARILAKALNGVEGPSDGELDILEIDAATHSKVEQVRELTESLRYKPVHGKYKVVVLDEVHRLSRQAFDALLKIVEEPPEHLVFIFATTEVEQVPATILSRCQEFSFHRVPFADLVAHLRTIAEAESIVASDNALRLIARAGEGSVRDAVALLDQLATFGSGTVEDEEASRLLGGVDAEVHHGLLSAILAGDGAAVGNLVAGIESEGRDPRHVFGEFLRYCRDALHLALGADPSHTELPAEEAAAAAEIARRAGYENLLRILHLLLASEETVRRSEVGLLAAEIAWLRAAELPKLTSLETVLSGAPTPAASDPPQRTPPPESSRGGHRASPDTEKPTPRPAPVTLDTNGTASDAVTEDGPASRPGVPSGEGHGRVRPRPGDARSATSSEATENGEIPSGHVDTPQAFLDLLSRYRQPLAAHLAHADALRIEGKTLRVYTDDPDFLERALRRSANREALERALTEGLGEGASWELVARQPPDADAPDGAAETEAPEQDGTAAADHPTVQAALELFGGTIESIEPREEP
ncbi:MAG: DNA polymerase III subunit gamma/tau [Thermoanaerobaculia bacterium]